MLSAGPKRSITGAADEGLPKAEISGLDSSLIEDLKHSTGKCSAVRALSVSPRTWIVDVEVSGC